MNQWVSTHQASTEYDLSVGLRENFSARKTWQSAFAKVRAASRLNAAGIMARQRHDSLNSLQSGISGGWKTIAGEESDPEDTPLDEIVPSPEDENTPPRAPPDKGPPTHHQETKLGLSEGSVSMETAQDASLDTDSTIKRANVPIDTSTTGARPRPRPLPSINIVSPVAGAPAQRPLPKHTSSMPGSFDGADEIFEEEEDKAAKRNAEPLATASSSNESPLDDLWNVASRVKKLVIG